MKKLVYIMMIAVLAVSCSIGKTAEQKALESRVDSVAHIEATKAMASGYFVVQTTSISDNYGHLMTGLSPDANFVLVQNDKGMLQVAPMRADMGLNGLGGITLHGYMRDVDLKVPDTPLGEVSMKYMLVGADVNATIFITLHKGSDMATVTAIPTLGSGTMTMRGRLVPYRDDNLNIQP